MKKPILLLVLFFSIACVQAQCDPQGTPCDDGDSTTIFDEEDGNCNCVGLPDNVSEGVYNIAIDTDDAEQQILTQEMILTNTDLELFEELPTEIELVGIRYTNIQIPEGSLVDRAYIQFTADNNTADFTSISIRGELANNSTTFISTINDIGSRPLTSEEALWNDVPEWTTIGEAGLDQRTIYITDVVNEIISQPGWESGNAITFIFSGEGNRVAESFESDGGAVLSLFIQDFVPCEPAGTPCDDGDPLTYFDVEDGNCNCAGIPETGTISIQVNNGSSDAEEDSTNGVVDIESSDLELVFDSGNQSVGVRFRGIPLPSQHTTITNAYIQFTVDEVSTDPTSLVITGDSAVDAAVFEEVDFDISNRSVTTSQVTWDNVPAWNTVGEQGVDQQTPNLGPIIEEVINGLSWDISNDIAFIITGTGERVAESYDGDAANAPTLVIEYTIDVLGECPREGTPCDDGDATTSFDEEDGSCNCIGFASDVSQVNFEIQLPSDDAEEELSTGDTNNGSSDLELVLDDENQVVGLRYINIQLPQGEQVERAYIQFSTDEDDNFQETDLLIHGELSANSATFTETIGNISSRSLTVNNTLWTDIPTWLVEGEAGLDQKTFYVTDIVNEILGQSDWEQGGAITFIISGIGKRTAESFDGDGGPVLSLFTTSLVACNPGGTPCDDGDPSTTFDVEDGNCNCIGILNSGTLEIPVSRASDDAEEEDTGEVDISSSDLELVFDGSNQTVGIRFQGVQLPATANILNAYIQFTVDEDNADATSVVIKGESSANSATFEELDTNISSRSTTTGEVAWNDIPAWNTIGDNGPDQQTPDVSAIVAEVLQDANWIGYNPITFIITGTGERVAESFNGDAPSAPVLVIDYDLDPLGINDNENHSKFKVFPNPSDGTYELQMDETYEGITLTIYTIAGSKLQSTTYKESSNSQTIDLSNQTAGVYFLNITTKDGASSTVKLLKM